MFGSCRDTFLGLISFLKSLIYSFSLQGGEGCGPFSLFFFYFGSVLLCQRVGSWSRWRFCVSNLSLKSWVKFLVSLYKYLSKTIHWMYVGATGI